MDIFGVGLPELIIIGLVIVVVAGPQRSAIWARELGRYISKFRQYLSALMAELENEVGPDGRELLDAAREFKQQTTELRDVTSRKGVLEQINKLVVDDLPSANIEEIKTNPKTDIKPQVATTPYEGWAKPSETSSAEDSEISEE